MKQFKIKYPRLLLLVFTAVAAVFLFYEGKTYAPFHNFLVSLGYAGTFAAGAFYAYGFTASPATAVLLVLAKEQNILLAVLAAGVGALLSDMVIFFFIRYTFAGELRQLEKEKIVRKVYKKEKKVLGRYSKYVLPAFAGFLIASPFPTEAGVAMLAASRKITVKEFAVIAYLLHTAGIFLILLIGNAI